MTRNNRRVVFYLFCILFLILSSIIVVYSKGWRFDFKKMRLVATGAIYLETKPPGVNIYLNNEFQKQTLNFSFFSSALFQDMKPDYYNIKIEKDGYFSWTKTLIVKPNLVTEAKDIELFLKKPVISEADFSEIPVQSAFGDFYFKKNGLFYKKVNGQETQLTIVPVLAPKKFVIILSKQGKILARQLNEDGALYYFNDEKKVLEKIDQGIIQASFSPDENKILYQNDHEIWVYDLDYKNKNEKQTLITRSAEPIKISSWLGDRAYIAYISGGVIKIAELDNRDQRNIIEFFPSDGDLLYFDSNSQNLYFLSKKQLYKAQIQ